MTTKKKPLSIEVKVTDRCNMECNHCVNNDGPTKSSDLDWKLFNCRLEEWSNRRTSSDFAIQEVRMTGGEPLVCFDSVLEIASCCRDLGIKSGINTNGHLLDPDRIRSLQEYGIELMKISFDSVDSPVFTNQFHSNRSTQNVFQSIRELVSRRIQVILRFTLSRSNLDQLQPCYQSALDFGVSKFQVKPLIRAGRAVGLKTHLDRKEVNEALEDMAEKFADSALPVEVLCWPSQKNTFFSYRLCGNIDKIYVSTAMSTSICNYIREEKNQARLGNLANTPLEEILKNRLTNAWAQKIDIFQIPKGCPNSDLFERSST